MTITTRAEGTGKSYTGSLRPAIMVIAWILVIHVIVMAIFGTQIGDLFWIVNIIAVLIYALIFSIMAFQATQIAIVVYEDGLDWQRAGSHLFTTWDNIASIDSKMEGDATSYGIHLREAVTPEVNSPLAKRFFSAPVDYIRLIPTVTVPTKWEGAKGSVIDMDALSKTDFGQSIGHYAPHLFDNENP